MDVAVVGIIDFLTWVHGAKKGRDGIPRLYLRDLIRT